MPEIGKYSFHDKGQYEEFLCLEMTLNGFHIVNLAIIQWKSLEFLYVCFWSLNEFKNLFSED